jgi:hypothetical protein
LQEEEAVATTGDTAAAAEPTLLPVDRNDVISLADISAGGSDAPSSAETAGAAPKTPKLRRKHLKKAVRSLSIDLDSAPVLQDQQAQELFADLLHKTKMVRSESR